jgi:hypothetical protein
MSHYHESREEELSWKEVHRKIAQLRADTPSPLEEVLDEVVGDGRELTTRPAQ